MNVANGPVQVPTLPMDLQIAVQLVESAIAMIGRHPCWAYRTIAMTMAANTALSALVAPAMQASIDVVNRRESGVPDPPTRTCH